MPTRISSAVMTWSFSLPGRFSVSSPFEVLHRAVGRPAGGTLYLSGRCTPLCYARNGPFAYGRTARDRSELTWLTLIASRGRSHGSNLQEVTHPML